MSSTPVSIESLIGHAMRDALQKWCIDSVPDDDASRASHVILGKPTRELRDNIVVSVHTQHPLGPSEDTDKLIEGVPRGQDERPLQFFRESTGGARTEMMVGAVQIRIRENMKHEDALNISGVVMDRVKKAINRDGSLKTMSDELGNTMMLLETFQHSGHAAGGGSTSIFIRWVDWRAIIVSDNSRVKE